LVAARFGGIIVNLLTLRYFDIALRDLGLLLVAAVALARLAVATCVGSGSRPQRRC
jgi:hypothetical protein